MPTDYKTHEVQETIDGLVYTNAKLPTTLGLMVWPQLIVALGEPILKEIINGTLATLAQDSDVAVTLALRVARSAAQLDLDSLAKTLLTHTRVNRYRDQAVATDAGGVVLDRYDEHFAGEYLHLLKVLAFVVKHNLTGPTLGRRSISGAPGTRPDGSATTPESNPPTSIL